MDKRTVVSNILDPIHDSLTPYIWDNPAATKPKLKSVHREWILNRVHELAERFHPNPKKWLTLVLTGSLTTYQYSDDSDVDVSLFVDHNIMPDWDRAKLIGLMVQHMDGTNLPGTPFPMQCFVVPPEVHREDLYQIGLRSGYDIDSDGWLIPPDKDRTHNVEKEYNAYYVYALESADKMERLLRYEPDKAIMFWHQIHKRRRRDHQAGKGDYSEANIVYKFLANRGLFPRIAEVSGEYIAHTAARPDWLPYTYYPGDVVSRWTQPKITGEVLDTVQGKIRVRWNVASPRMEAITYEEPNALHKIENKAPQQQNLFSAATYDPVTCQYCGAHQMTPPKQQGAAWVQKCLSCQRSRIIPSNHPFLQMMQQQTPYPDALSEVGPERPWTVLAWNESWDDVDCPRCHGWTVSMQSPMHDPDPDKQVMDSESRRECMECGHQFYPKPELNTKAPSYVRPAWERDPLEEQYDRPSGLQWNDVRNSSGTRAIYQPFKVVNPHPGPPDMPFTYDPKLDMVFLGPPGAYHKDLIPRIPELKDQYPEQMNVAPVALRPDHLHGRMTPEKEISFYDRGLWSEEATQKVAEALRGKEKAQPDGDWTDETFS